MIMACKSCSEDEISKISFEIFKTKDYESMLAILPAYDGMVKEFNRKIEKLKQRKGEA